MTGTLPRREVHYFTNVSDSARWDHFTKRNDDIFVCTPPKTGTTWTQTLCCLLLFGWRDFDIKPSDVSPWYDATFEDVEATNATINAQQHRRIIKTHTPLDGIPYEESPTYLTVYRDPRDVFFSVMNHRDNFKRLDFSVDDETDMSTLFREWAEKPASNGEPASGSLESFVLHYKSFKSFENLPNIHYFHYSAMKQNLPATLEALARILGISVDAEDVKQMSRIADFQNMRKNADQFTPDARAGIWKENERFFNKGSSGQWQDALSAEDLAFYDRRISGLLSAEEAAWLHQG